MVNGGPTPTNAAIWGAMDDISSVYSSVISNLDILAGIEMFSNRMKEAYTGFKTKYDEDSDAWHAFQLHNSQWNEANRSDFGESFPKLHHKILKIEEYASETKTKLEQLFVPAGKASDSKRSLIEFADSIKSDIERALTKLGDHPRTNNGEEENLHHGSLEDPANDLEHLFNRYNHLRHRVHGVLVFFSQIVDPPSEE